VRELENAIEYALNMVGDRAVVQPEELPDRIQGVSAAAAATTAIGTARGADEAVAALPKDLLLDEAVMALEVEWINRAMQVTGGNISQAARTLGLSRQGLHNKLAKYGIKGDAGGDAAA
jgi:DNA-binding NtrC family response regulator